MMQKQEKSAHKTARMQSSIINFLLFDEIS